MYHERAITVTIKIRHARFSNFHHNLRTLWNLMTQDRMCEPYYVDNAEDGKWHARGLVEIVLRLQVLL